jgi:hypothetical protein
LSLLWENGQAVQYSINDFLNVYRNGLDVIFTDEEIKSFPPNSPVGNLFENFLEEDLSYLKGYAMILPGEKLKDDVIFGVDNNRLGVALKERETKLFSYKPKLTQGEIQAFLGQSLQSYNNSLSDYLKKNLKENVCKNPFDESVKCILYEPKY